MATMTKDELLKMIDEGKMKPVMKVLKHATAHDQTLHDQVVDAEKRYDDLKQPKTITDASPRSADAVQSYDIINNDLKRVAQQLPDNVSVTDDIASLIYNSDQTPQNESLPRVETLPNEPTDRTSRLEVILGVIFLLIGLTVALLVDCPTTTQLFVIRLFLALGAAAFAAIIPGVLNVTALKSIISAGGGLAVFALVYFLNPGEDMAQEGCDQTFDFRVRLQVERPSADYPPLQDAELKLFIGDDYREVDINSESGVYDFRSLPNAVLETTAVAQLEADFWTLQSDEITISEATPTITIIPDGTLETITGRVLDEAGNPVADARVDLGIPRGQTTTGDNGFFELELPLEIQRLSYEVTIRKDGYQNKTQVIDLTQSTPQIVLQQEE
ncbi:MAG: carboxypeptidase-like regulatory domain-containing protein [Bacteroidota bacterium]